MVTAAYHMPRALAELRRQLPHTVLVAYPVHPLVGWRVLLGEYGKFTAVLLGIDHWAQSLGIGWAEHAG